MLYKKNSSLQSFNQDFFFLSILCCSCKAFSWICHDYIQVMDWQEYHISDDEFFLYNISRGLYNQLVLILAVLTLISFITLVSTRYLLIIKDNACSVDWQLSGLQPARLFCSWYFPSKNTRVSCHALLQGIFMIQASNWRVLHCRQILYC